jgi:TolB protein
MNILLLIILQKSIFFASIDYTNYFVKEMNLKTKKVETILKSEKDITALTVSVEGLIVYRTNDGIIRIYNTETKSHQILEIQGKTSDPQFSPDGKKILYCLEKSEQRDDWDLCLYDFKTNKHIVLNYDEGLDCTPSWGPESKLIYFSTGQRGIMILYLLDIITNEKKKILENEGFYELEPAVSPDGKKLAFSSNRAGDFDIWVFDSKDSIVKRVTEDKGFEGKPVWLSNSEIIYEANHPEHWGIWLIDIKSKEKRLLTPKGEKCRYPAIGY